MPKLDFVRTLESMRKAPIHRQLATLGRVGVYLPLTFVLLCFAWWRCLPVFPGYCLSALVLVGMILTVRADVSRFGEKLLWVFIGVALLLAEVRVAQRGRVDANSYLLCTFSEGAALVGLQGTADIHSAYMHVVDQFGLNAFKVSQSGDGDQYSRLFQDIPLGDFSKGQHKLLYLRPLQMAGSVAHYRVRFDAENGKWWEDIQIRVIGGEQVQALRVLRYRGLTPEVLFEHEDPGFPRSAENRVDWSWANLEF
ncbi:MAG: hypothetical protein ACRYFU_03455 [Janthinobacterium lividum]